MKRLTVTLFVFVFAIANIAAIEKESLSMTQQIPADDVDHFSTDGGEKNPALAAVLSIVPTPLALGQFYVGNWRRGLLFSFGELVLSGTAMGTMMVQNMHPRLNDRHGHRHAGMTSFRDWDQTAQVLFVGSLSAFVVTKFVDAILAASEAEKMAKFDRVAETVSPSVTGRE